MALTPSTMKPLGTPAPAFRLPDVVSNAWVALEDFAGQPALLVMFLCRHCPYVKHVEKEVSRLGNEAFKRGVAVVAISSNDAVSHPDDGPDFLREQSKELGFLFPYLYDESQAVAKSFGAACTPDFFLYDRDRRLVYRGQMDDSRPGNGKPVTGNDLRRAIDAVVTGKPVDTLQRPSAGCNIKWKSGVTL